MRTESEGGGQEKVRHGALRRGGDGVPERSLNESGEKRTKEEKRNLLLIDDLKNFTGSGSIGREKTCGGKADEK